MVGRRGIGQIAQRPEHVEPAFGAQLVVAQHQIERLQLPGMHRLCTVGHADGYRAERLEQLDKLAPQGVIVLDDKDIRRVHAVHPYQRWLTNG